MLNIGYHASISNISNMLDIVNENGIGVIQIFITSNISFSKCTLKTNELNKLKNAVKNGIKIFIHGPYVINLSNTDISNFNRCKSVLLDQLRIANIINADGVIIHMGKALSHSEEVAMTNFVNSIKEIIKDYNGEAKLILETSAGQGTEICKSLNNLSLLFNRFTKNEKNKLGICIDTCHIFAAGYDLSNTESVKKNYKKIKKLFKLKYIKCIHLNDSKCDVGCKKDRHQDIGYGKIGINNLRYLYKKFNKHNIPMIIETPTENIDYIKQINSLIK